MKFGCAICTFLKSENLICRSMDISKCFRGSLQLRDNESRLYIYIFIYIYIYIYIYITPSIWETARHRLNYCIKSPLDLKQPTNQLKRRGGPSATHSTIIYIYPIYIFCLNYRAKQKTKCAAIHVLKWPYRLNPLTHVTLRVPDRRTALDRSVIDDCV